MLVAAAPEQVIPVRPGREIRPSCRQDPALGKRYLGRVVVDYDDDGNLISIEVLDASTRVQEPRSVTLATHG